MLNSVDVACKMNSHLELLQQDSLHRQVWDITLGCKFSIE
jgi:hypothetical protein